MSQYEWPDQEWDCELCGGEWRQMIVNSAQLGDGIVQIWSVENVGAQAYVPGPEEYWCKRGAHWKSE